MASNIETITNLSRRAFLATTVTAAPALCFLAAETRQLRRLHFLSEISKPV
jgi:hypothetical protein